MGPFKLQKLEDIHLESTVFWGAYRYPVTFETENTKASQLPSCSI